MPSDARFDVHPDVIGGRYRVERAIGRGGMGTVWLCRDEMLRRDVAVKQVGMLPGETVTDSARAMREARSSAGLSHRNVVTVFDVVEEGGAIWLVMEHVPSHSLADLIKREGPLEPARVADIGAQVADGLAAAHAAGTMHRDVKPGNVLVRDDGTAKISDFGIARSAGDPALTMSGLLTGTPSYFSPELARGAAPDPASDVWALGATLYAAVEGRPPYPPKDNPVAILHDIATQRPPEPRRAEFLEPVLLRMLDRNAGSRWSMADAAHALHRLVDAHPVEATKESTRVVATPGSETGGAGPARQAAPAAVPAPARTSAGDERPRRRGAVAALLAVGLLIVAVGMVYALNRTTGSDQGAAGGASTASTRSSSGARSSASSSGSGSSPATPGSSATGAAARTGLAGQQQFLRNYYAAAPGGTDAGWAQLGPREQRVGRSSYDGFWRTIESAQVSDVAAGASPNSVEATIRYRYASGRVVEERQRLELVRSGGRYLIDDDTVLSSRTVHP
jgi:serine/threonine protein kinase